MKKHIRAKPPVQLPKEAQKMTALNHPNVDQGQLFGANVSSTRPKQASKVQFLSPKFPGVTQPGTPENHGSVLLFTTKTQNRNCALATFFCFCTCVCFGPEIGPIGAWTSPSDDGRAGKLLAAVRIWSPNWSLGGGSPSPFSTLFRLRASLGHLWGAPGTKMVPRPPPTASGTPPGVNFS